MSGYPHNHNAAGNYPYGTPPPQPYGAPPPQPYGAPPPQPSAYSPYGAPSAPSAPYYAGSGPEKPGKPPKENYSHGGGYYGGGSAPGKPPKEDYSQAAYYGGGGGSAPPMPYGAQPPYGAPPPGAYGSPFASLVPSVFPPGTDPNVVACFQAADADRSGLIDDKELQGALSSYNQSFSLSTVHLLMYLFTNTNSRKIGPKEFTAVFYSLQNWRSIFDRYDRDRSGRIDTQELREALLSMGYAISPVVLELLVLKFDKTGGKIKAIEYDSFIECCLTVKGLTDKFKEKDKNYSGSATFAYEEFMLTVLPFLAV